MRKYKVINFVVIDIRYGGQTVGLKGRWWPSRRASPINAQWINVLPLLVPIPHVEQANFLFDSANNALWFIERLSV